MAGLDDAVWTDARGRVWINAQEVLASAEFQTMTLAERGAFFDRKTGEAAGRLRRPDRYIPAPDRQAVAARYGCAPGGTLTVRCPCGAEGEIRWADARVRFVGLDVDHVQPVSRGGKNEAANLQLLCPSCNRRKGARVGAQG